MSSVLFGSMAVCVRIAARGMGSSQIAFFRFAGSLLVLLLLRRGRGLRPAEGNLRPVLLRGLLGSFAILLYYHGIESAGAGFATLLHCTYPISTALFATTMIGERLDRRLGLALLLGMGGVFVVLGPGADLGSATLHGGLSALAASVLAGGAVATARYLRRTESAYLVTTYFMAVGTVCTAPSLSRVAAASSRRPCWSPCWASSSTSVAGQVLLHHGLGFAPAIQGSLAAATTVVSAAALEALWLGDHLSRHTMAGACLLVVAVAVAVSRRGST